MNKQLILCYYNGLQTEPVAVYSPKKDKWAKHAVRLHNADIVANNGDLDTEFWYLNETIGSKTRIITMTADQDFCYDSPEIVAKLGALEEQKQEGNAKRRGASINSNKKGYNSQ